LIYEKDRIDPVDPVRRSRSTGAACRAFRKATAISPICRLRTVPGESEPSDARGEALEKLLAEAKLGCSAI